MNDQTISTFQQSLRGRLIRQGDPDYDSARALYNGMIDKRPRLIARCADVADVITAANFGREQGLGLMDFWLRYGPPDDCELRDGKLICH